MIFLPHNFAAEWGKKTSSKMWKKFFFSSLNIFAKCDNGLLQTCLTLQLMTEILCLI